MDPSWIDGFMPDSVYGIYGQRDHHTPISNPFIQIDDIQLPAIPVQERFFMEPSELNLPMLNAIHNPSGFTPQQQVGCSGSIYVAECDGMQKQGLNDVGFSSGLQSDQKCNVFDSKVPSLIQFLNSNVDESSNPLLGHGHSGLLQFNSSARKQHKSSKRKTAYRSPSQREIHILAERQRREEMNEKFSILRSIIPKVTKKDKASIIMHTMKYLVELQKKVKWLRDRKVIRERELKARNESNSSRQQIRFAERMGNFTDDRSKDTHIDENQSIVTFSRHIGGGPGDVQAAQIEVETLGTEAVIKILCPWRPGLALRTHKALDECTVDVLQSNMTTHGGNVVQFFTIQLNRCESGSMDKLIGALQKVSTTT